MTSKVYCTDNLFNDTDVMMTHDRLVNCPIDNLCDDVLREIFLVCTSMYGSKLGYDDTNDILDSTLYKFRDAHPPSVKLPSDKQFLSPFPSIYNIPYVFLFINRRWRHLAQTTHTLWNRVSAMPNLSGDGRPSAQFIRHWLQLSGDTTPLYLHIAPSDLSTQDNDYSIRAWMEELEEKATLGLFFKYAERCRVLSIQFNKGLCQKLYEMTYLDSFNEPTKAFSQVETLELDTRNVEFDFVAPGWLSSFPALRHFRLLEHRSGHIHLDGLPFSRLETVFLKKYLQLDDAIALLRNCVSARDITLAGTLIGSVTRVFEGPKTTLPNLSRISIRSDPFLGPFSLLSHFAMPNLVELELYWSPKPYSQEPDWGEPTSVLLNRFLRDSRCRLRKMVLIDQRFSVSEINAIFNNLIVLQIPEVEILYAVEWLRTIPKARRKFCRNMKSPDFLRYYAESRDFFVSKGIDIHFWTHIEHFELSPLYSPYRVWEHVGWNKNLKGERKEIMWTDHAAGESYSIGIRLQ